MRSVVVKDEAWLRSKRCKTCGAGLTPPVRAYHIKGMYKCVGCHADTGIAWRKANPEAASRISKKKTAAARADPAELFKIKCRRKLDWAVECGRVKKLPCQRCGEIKVQAHHPDYSKPYDVMWLCLACHNEEHGRPSRSRPLRALLEEAGSSEKA